MIVQYDIMTDRIITVTHTNCTSISDLPNGEVRFTLSDGEWVIRAKGMVYNLKVLLFAGGLK